MLKLGAARSARIGDGMTHVVVTGGASGIGAAVVAGLIARGCTVSVFDVAVGAVPVGAAGVAVDVTSGADVSEAFDAAEAAFGIVTGIVCAAGVRGAYAAALDLDEIEMRRVFEVNVMGSFLPVREMVRRLSGAAASAVLVSSTTAYRGWARQADYGPSKAAVRQLTENLAIEWAELGVRVNAVAPGHTLTPMVQQLADEGYDLGPVRARTPLGRLAAPEEMAREIVHLLLDATFTTGQCIAVDGGWTALGK